MNSPFIAVLIADIIFISIALGLNKENAKYLLSGYNDMSKKERENFDIVNYLIFFKKYFFYHSRPPGLGQPARLAPGAHFGEGEDFAPPGAPPPPT